MEATPQPFEHELGTKVHDIITGFEGVVLGRTQWLTGCNTLGVNSGLDKDGRPTDSVWLDESRWVAVAAPVASVPIASDAQRGGPQETPQKGRH